MCATSVTRTTVTSLALGLALQLLCPVTQSARAQTLDLAEYDELAQRAIAAHTALGELEGAARLEGLEVAIERDSDLLEWLDWALAVGAISDLSSAEQQTLVGQRARATYLRSVAQVEVGRCEAASDNLRELLLRTTTDLRLRLRSVAAYEDATECLAIPDVAYLEVSCVPEGAEVFVDGVLRGIAAETHEILLGAHQVTLRAEGYESAEHRVVADVAGESYTLGPVALIESARLSDDAAETSRSSRKTWAWVVLGTGVALGGAALAYEISMADDRSDFEETGNAEAAARIDDAKPIIWALGTAGVIGITAGLLLLLIEDDDEVARRAAEGVSVRPTFGGWGVGFSF